MDKTSKIIGLFGSSFNPPHRGHQAVIQDLSQKDLFDEIWLIPVFRHPFNKDLAPLEHRLAMLQRLCQTLPPTVHINLIEQELAAEKSYAIDTVMALQKRHPQCRFSLILGSDLKDSLHRWHRYEDLKNQTEFHFIRRQGYEESPYPEVSSSLIRKLCQSNQSIDHLVPPPISDYLKQHKIYS